MNGTVSWEPLIVTTLRRYLRRRVPESLLLRLAGGVGNWRYLNATWNIDGQAYRPVPLGEAATDGFGYAGLELSTDERRIALLQVTIDHVETGEVFPTSILLGRYFGVSPYCIDEDLRVLREDGRIVVSVAGGNRGVRRILRIPGMQGATASPVRADA